MENEKNSEPVAVLEVFGRKEKKFSYSFGFEVGYSPGGLFARFKIDKVESDDTRPHERNMNVPEMKNRLEEFKKEGAVCLN